MNPQAMLAAFTEQIRRHPVPEGPTGYLEHDDRVIRTMSAAGGWTGVSWCDLDSCSADTVIAAQVRRFGKLSGTWEWKHYSCDQPPDLAKRLLAAGFTSEPAESLLVAEIADLALDVPPPPGVTLRPVDESTVSPSWYPSTIRCSAEITPLSAGPCWLVFRAGRERLPAC